MKNLRFKSIALVLVMIMFAWNFMPPGEKLRLGKDLRGGTTLVYSVEIDPGENAKEVLGQVIEVLKDRVDPNGTFDISMVAQGQDRIEITMPLPSDRVKELRKAFEDELAKIDEASIPRSDFERVMRLEATERTARFDQVSAPGTELRSLLDDAADAIDEAISLRRRYEMLQTTQALDEVLDAVASQIANAEIAYEQARDAAIDAMPSSDELLRIINLPDRPLILKDEITNEYQSLASSRERALTKFRSLNDARLGSLIDSVFAAYDAYITNRTSLDDPSDLVRLLRGAGVLSFRITIDPTGSGSTNTHPEEDRLREELHEKGPVNVRARDARWIKINRIEAWLETVQELDLLDANPTAYFASRGLVAEEYEGEYWILCWDTPDRRLTTESNSSWAVASAYMSTDQSGKPAIGFRMNTIGASLFGELTGGNVGNRMAVLLDDEAYTAPNINSRISRTGIIMGNFSSAEREYIIRVLNAGSLQAKLSTEPLSESTIAPELGKDNLDAGLKAGVIALIVVSAFMVFYYFGYGLIAVLALLANAIIILGSMALAKAAFSLPGIAGVILTFGMAVDANVLIFERVREELGLGNDLRTAVRLGYAKALSSIVDGNVTNLIVCVVLGNLGTPEIKGFAITLGIGVCSTLFSALFISRILMVFITDVAQLKHMRMLPMAIPALGRLLEPKIQWLKLRWVFVAISTFYVGLGLFMVFSQGEKMLDMEFRGGVQVTLKFGEEDNGQPMTMTRADVQQRIQAIAEGRDEFDPLRPLRNAEVVPVNPEAGGVTSDSFHIKAYLMSGQEVSSTTLGSAGNEIAKSPTDQMVEAIITAFSDKIETKAPVAFVGDRRESMEGAPVFEITTSKLGTAIGRSQYSENISSFIGGVAILIEIDPARTTVLPTLQGLEDRLHTMRSKPDFAETVRHRTQLMVLEGTQDAVSMAVLLVSDARLSSFDNKEVWRTTVAEPEWDLVRGALTETTTLASVQTFSPVIAESFKQTAVVSVVMSFLLILIYIWVRFGSVRYSLAAIVCLLHDVLTVLGLIAMAEIVYDHETLQPFAQAIGIQPFKIDLNLVAAMLTIIGYSLNDTIIVMDRIRENRGKLPYATTSVINDSINQTISRTIITSGTTLLATLILFFWGGDGVRAFSYALMMGVLVGTYSSIAVAAPLVWSKKTGGPVSSGRDLTT